MIGELSALMADRHREALLVQRFNGAGDFQVVLAGAGKSGELPRRYAIDQERIVDGLGDFMAESGHVLNPGLKQPRGNPAGKDRDPDRNRRDRVVEEESVEAERQAALRTLVNREKESIRQQHDIQRIGGQAACAYRVCYRIEERLIKELVEQDHKGAVVIGRTAEIGSYLFFADVALVIFYERLGGAGNRYG